MYLSLSLNIARRGVSHQAELVGVTDTLLICLHLFDVDVKDNDKTNTQNTKTNNNSLFMNPMKLAL